jgi:N-sulfoglucosamine sulfohydrolase
MRSGVTWNHSRTLPGTKSVCNYLSDLGYRVGNSGKRHAAPAETEVVKAFPAGDGVRDFMTRDAAEPFCLFLCSENPHASWTTGDATQFDPEKLVLAPVQHDDEQTRQAMTRYLAEVSELDREVGEILGLLEDTGQAGNTLVMFSSEQGWSLGFGKWSNWNLGVHTALLARWPGRIGPGTKTDALVQMADVVPTLIDAAGGAPKAYGLDGSSFLGVLTGKQDAHREYVYCMHNNVPEGKPYPIRSIFSRDFHYLWNLTPEASYQNHYDMVVYKEWGFAWWPLMKEAAASGDARAQALLDKYHHRPAEELYRVATDPFEMENLAGAREYAGVKAELRAELERWMKAQGDPGAALDSIEAYGPRSSDNEWLRYNYD